ncbi:hypothetical protein [Pseudorhodoplanes sinuspersici]|uniref:hypothetical protein n=1 Tax=Pseudorhodoplanes sinuspersici TaxID=1235591 RepID=UPI0011C459C8|nr:hypothetical protein [Pseudorhodoplanes sinuspersici]
MVLVLDTEASIPVAPPNFRPGTSVVFPRKESKGAAQPQEQVAWQSSSKRIVDHAEAGTGRGLIKWLDSKSNLPIINYLINKITKRRRRFVSVALNVPGGSDF